MYKNYLYLTCMFDEFGLTYTSNDTIITMKVIDMSLTPKLSVYVC
jgi:hypothetical protein